MDPGPNPVNSFSGGGSGTVVIIGADLRTAEPILVAGGGGSWRTFYSEMGDPTLCHATIERTGVNGGFGLPGGPGGAGSRHRTQSDAGSGAAGFSGSVTDCFDGMTSAAQSFRDGGIGGTFKGIRADCNGGFGCGGCGGWGGSGGVGGYSGGSPGNDLTVMSAGGGGSFNLGLEARRQVLKTGRQQRSALRGFWTGPCCCYHSLFL